MARSEGNGRGDPPETARICETSGLKGLSHCRRFTLAEVLAVKPLWLLPSLFLAAAITLAAGPATPQRKAPEPEAALPTAEDLSGWKADGPVRRYPRGKLHILLNGAAPVLEEYGLEIAAVREWAREGRMISVMVLRMKDRIGALGVMTQVRGASWRDLAGAPGGYETDLQSGFLRGRWFVQIDVLEGGKEVLTVVRRLARLIHGRLSGTIGGDSKLLADLRTPTLVPRSGMLLRGPLALAGAEPFAGALAVDGFEMGAVAGYRCGKRRARMLLASYDSEKSATAALLALAAALEMPGDPGVLLSARSGKRRVLAWREETRIRVIIK
jgi:Family of unknown function (DUF6599)